MKSGERRQGGIDCEGGGGQMNSLSFRGRTRIFLRLGQGLQIKKTIKKRRGGKNEKKWLSSLAEK